MCIQRQKDSLELLGHKMALQAGGNVVIQPLWPAALYLCADLNNEEAHPKEQRPQGADSGSSF